MSYLMIERVIASEVTCTGCSSHDGVHDLSFCIIDDNTTWWLSAPQSMPQGQGQEYVQFQLGPKPRHVSCIGISLPPLPQGPMSVHTFQLEIPHSKSCIESDNSNNISWIPITPILQTSNQHGMQMFPCQADTQDICIVCLSNKM
jgi:hypothetical protein